MDANRIDLTDWVIHFVHDRKLENETLTVMQRELAAAMAAAGDADAYEFNDVFDAFSSETLAPDFFDANGQEHAVDAPEVTWDEDFADDASAFDVLRKILHDGFIRSSWSFRNGRATIYGPSSAVCFTEMPLYALMEYARWRNAFSDYVGHYGIAFRRKELYAAGARPVIYGLSGKHVEATADDPFAGFGFRVLSTRNTGIGLGEQYRYVFTDLTRDRDWTFEREWRWPLRDGSTGVSGLPFLLSSSYASFFSEIIVIVQTNAEVRDVLAVLRSVYDAGRSTYSYYYDPELIARVKVVSLESLAQMGDVSHVRLEDIPFRQMAVMPQFTVTPELKAAVAAAVQEANRVSEAAISSWLSAHPDYHEDGGSHGFASVATYEQTEVTAALLEVAEAQSDGKGCYSFYLDQFYSPDVDLLNVGLSAAADFLTKTFHQPFFAQYHLD